MPTYFKPLRRKIGLTTLVVACVFAVGWIRSTVTFDNLIVNYRGSIYAIGSRSGKTTWSHMTVLGLPNFELTANRPFISRQSRAASEYNDSPVPFGHIRRNWNGFEYLHWDDMTDEPTRKTRWIIPYWSIVIPLTLLSAWLLLSPRQKPEIHSHPSNQS